MGGFWDKVDNDSKLPWWLKKIIPTLERPLKPVVPGVEEWRNRFHRR